MEWESLFRLCHVCGHINEGEKEILRCANCAKAYLPFSSLEKILLAAGLGGQVSQGEKAPKPAPANGPQASANAPAKTEQQPVKAEPKPAPKSEVNIPYISISGLIVFW